MIKNNYDNILKMKNISVFYLFNFPLSKTLFIFNYYFIAQLFDSKLKQRLCNADLDYQLLKDTEEELLRLKHENMSQSGEIRRLQVNRIFMYFWRFK